MVQWYQSNHRLFREERAALAVACPLMRLAVLNTDYRLNASVSLKKACAVAHGVYGLRAPEMDQSIEYKIAVVFPEKYPRQIPILVCDDPKLPIGEIDRHIMSDGSCCLGVHSDINSRWTERDNITSFLETFAAPFLAWQAYYDEFKTAPPWGERSHAGEGILEFYAELLGVRTDSTVLGFMQLLARKNTPKGHEPCPCNSGKRLRNCHRELIYAVRKRVSWINVAQDLETFKEGLKQSPISRSEYNENTIYRI